MLFMSGCTEDQVFRHGVQSGEVTFIRKPFSTRDLATRVREVLDTSVAR
ncbi:hypothetical protein J8F10_15855 [Gemmata sp. G18]|uniref:Response regulatory domain-containing protein n=1 Tax=Gemmata palustris TaxID=2822762 RepID=A0ABS5BSN1_9BACT|nr:hypothetical protein [Gemmata palustris]MBP3956747.1 hypothetical protein [Gemmata palustris]